MTTLDTDSSNINVNNINRTPLPVQLLITEAHTHTQLMILTRQSQPSWSYQSPTSFRRLTKSHVHLYSWQRHKFPKWPLLPHTVW